MNKATTHVNAGSQVSKSAEPNTADRLNNDALYNESDARFRV